MADIDPKSATATEKVAALRSIPGSASSAHPSDAIPLPAHGFETLDSVPARQLAAVPPSEVITRAAVVLIGAAAERVGLNAADEPDLDLDAARPLITALAGLLAASGDQLGSNRDSLEQALRSLQGAYREASRYPDAPGDGPGEQYLS